MVTKLGC